MTDKAGDPQFARYSNRELEAFLTNPTIGETQKSQIRQELTRRLRDDLLRSAHQANKAPQEQRRQRATKVSKLVLILILLLICLVSALCVYLLLPYLRPVINPTPGPGAFLGWLYSI